MEIQDLRQSIEDGILGDELLVFVCPTDMWLADKYIDLIAESKGLAINKINSLEETTDMSPLALIMNFDEKLNVLKTETFDEYSTEYYAMKNIIVVCNQVDKKIESLVAPYVIKMPKLVDWQVKDYMTLICPELNEKALEWLYNATKGNIYRIDNELAKLNMFDSAEKLTVLEQLANDPYTDLVVPIGDIFKIVEAVLGKKTNELAEVLAHVDQYQLEPIGLTTLLLNKFKLMALIRLKDNVTDKDLGPLAKQAKWSKYPSISSMRYTKSIKFLSSVDFRLKNGDLDFPGDTKEKSQALLCYIINHLLSY